MRLLVGLLALLAVASATRDGAGGFSTGCGAGAGGSADGACVRSCVKDHLSMRPSDLWSRKGRCCEALEAQTALCCAFAQFLLRRRAAAAAAAAAACSLGPPPPLNTHTRTHSHTQTHAQNSNNASRPAFVVAQKLVALSVDGRVRRRYRARLQLRGVRCRIPLLRAKPGAAMVCGSGRCAFFVLCDSSARRPCEQGANPPSE